MTDDIFSVKELREIVLSFPSTASNAERSNDAQRPSLITSASGNALWLDEQLRKRVLHTLQHSRQRLVLSTFAQDLDVGSRDFLALLGGPDTRPLWCYNAGIHTIIPSTELAEILRELRGICSSKFLDQHDFCAGHDIHATDLKYHIRNLNARLADGEQLGVGKWYEDTSSSSRSAEYIYSYKILASTKDAVRERLQHATEARKKVSIELKIFRGLDTSSALCFTHKVLEPLFDYNHDHINKCSLSKGLEDGIVFTPSTADLAQKEERIQYFLDKVNWWIARNTLTSQSMPTLPLLLNGDSQQHSVDEALSESVKIIKAIAPSERLVRICEYVVTYRSLRTLADRILATVEEAASVELSAPRTVKIYDAEKFINKLYDIIVTDFSSDEGRLVRVGLYVALKTTLDAAKTDMIKLVQHEAAEAWTRYAKDPPSTPFPDTLPIEPLLSAATTLAPVNETGFYDTVARDMLGNVTSWRTLGQHSWRASISAQETAYEARFATAYSTHVLARLRVYQAAVLALEPGKLRNDLTALLREHLLKDFLSDALRLMTDKENLKPCGRHVSQALSRLEADLRSSLRDSGGADADGDLDTVVALHMREGNKLKAPPITTERLSDAKKSMLTDTLSIARSAKSDTNGSRTFLCVVLVLWARRSEGMLYATGRFVPRLLKLLQGKVDDTTYERLQKLKDVVKDGNMTDEQRQELLGTANSDAGLEGGNP